MALNPEPMEEDIVVEEVFVGTTAPTRESRPSLGNLISQAVEQFFTLVKAEIALVKARFKQAAQKMAGGIGLLVVAFMTVFVLLLWIFHSIEMAFAIFLPGWAAALVTTGLILLIIVILAAIGVAMLKKGSEEIPDVSGGIQADIDSIKEGLSK